MRGALKQFQFARYMVYLNCRLVNAKILLPGSFFLHLQRERGKMLCV